MSQTVAPCSVELRVRYPETDQMGVVYHANYLAWCDVGRTELLRALGKPYAELEREGILLAVSEVSLRYHASARYDDRIRVETWLEEVRSRAVTFAYRISRIAEDGTTERLVTARTTLVALTREGSPQKLPPEMLRGLKDALIPGGG